MIESIEDVGFEECDKCGHVRRDHSFSESGWKSDGCDACEECPGWYDILPLNPSPHGEVMQMEEVTEVNSEQNSYGFSWGNLAVQRTAVIGKRRILTVSTPYDSITVYISAEGKKIRVFRENNHELIS